MSRQSKQVSKRALARTFKANGGPARTTKVNGKKYGYRNPPPHLVAARAEAIATILARTHR